MTDQEVGEEAIAKMKEQAEKDAAKKSRKTRKDKGGTHQTAKPKERRKMYHLSTCGFETFALKESLDLRLGQLDEGDVVNCHVITGGTAHTVGYRKAFPLTKVP